MILRKVVIAGIALGAIAGFAVVSQPAEAGGCVVVSAKTRGVVEAGANKRSHDKLTRHINHWAKKNGLKTVHVGYAQTSCTKGSGVRLHRVGESLPLGFRRRFWRAS